LKVLKNKKVELSEQDLHIIDIYSKKNLTDTMPQFGNPNSDFLAYVAGMDKLKNEKINDSFE